METLPEQGRAHKTAPFSVLSCAEFMKGPDKPEYLIDGILERGRSLLIAGPYKANKTKTADDLALSLSAGVPAMGCFTTRRARVLMVSGETPPEDKRRSLNVIAAARGVALPVDDLLFADGWFPRIPEDVPKLVATLKRVKPDVLILDPWYRAMGSAGQHAGNLFVVGAVLGALSEAAEREGCATVILHHTNEQLQPGQRPELRHVAFAGFAQWARSWLLLNRRSRYVEGSGKHSLLMVTGGSSGHSGAWHLDVDEGTPTAPHWCVTVAPASRSAGVPTTGAPTADAEDATKVVEFLARYPNGETKSEIKNGTGLGTERTAQALEALTVAGRVERCRVPKSGCRSGYDGYRLPSQKCEARDNVGGPG